jgi:hypothetical protein
MKRLKMKPKRSSGSTSRPQIRNISIALVRGVDERLRVLGKTWHWLAERIEARGIAHAQSIWQWRRGASQQIGCAVYVAVLEELNAEDAAQRRETNTIRIGDDQ